MTFLPIVERELRVASRRKATYWGRFAAGVVAVIIGGWILIGGQLEMASQREIGPALFATLSALVFIYVAVAGTQLTCDCLSTERREGTLGLLFLTDLRGYDVVFGKLAASSVNALYGVLAVLPVLAFPILMGGVSGGELWRVALVALNLMFFFLSVGIFSSAVCREDQRALALSISISLGLLLISPLSIGFISTRYPYAHWYSDTLWLPCPAFDCVTAFEDNYKGSKDAFWLNALITQGYAWTFLWLACRIVPRSWQEQGVGPKRGVWRDRWRRALQGSSTARAALRARLLDINPFLWRVSHSRAGQITPWLFLGGAAACWYGLQILFDPPNSKLFDEPFDFMTVLVVHFVLKFWIASEAGRCFAEDRRTGALELLLTTPLTGAEIVKGQRAGLWRRFALPVILVLLIDFLFLSMALARSTSSSDTNGWLMSYLTIIGFLAPDLNALVWQSMKLGLTGRKPNRIAMLSYAKVVFLPFVISVVCITFSSITGASAEFGVIIFCFVVPAAITDVMFTTTAQFDLVNQFSEGTGEKFGQTRAPQQAT